MLFYKLTFIEKFIFYSRFYKLFWVKPAVRFEKIIILTICFCFSFYNIVNATDENQEAKNFRTFSFYFENDVFSKTDRGYTNGLKLSWYSKNLKSYGDEKRLPRLGLRVIESLPFVNEPNNIKAFSLAIGQNMYTPEDKDNYNLVKHDRPYAGILYLSIGLHSFGQIHMDTLKLDLGVVGPSSFAGETQSTIHRILGNDVANGWDNQLKDEPAIEIAYEHKWKLIENINNKWGYDFLVQTGARLGNVNVSLNAGVEARVGIHMPKDFGIFLIGPSSDSNMARSDKDARIHGNRWGVHLFVAADGRYVQHDITLDGNTFRDSHHVEKEPFTSDLISGIGIIAERLKLTFCTVYRTKQFKGERQHPAFGAVTVSYLY